MSELLRNANCWFSHAKAQIKEKRYIQLVNNCPYCFIHFQSDVCNIAKLPPKELIKRGEEAEVSYLLRYISSSKALRTFHDE